MATDVYSSGDLVQDDPGGLCHITVARRPPLDACDAYLAIMTILWLMRPGTSADPFKGRWLPRTSVPRRIVLDRCPAGSASGPAQRTDAAHQLDHALKTADGRSLHVTCSSSGRDLSSRG